MSVRPSKTLRLVYNSSDPNIQSYLMLLGNPNEVRLGTGSKTFIGIRDDGISLSPGMGGNVNIQGMSHNLRYAGMIMDLPFPMSLIPSTMATPLPKQVIMPPLAKIVPFLVDLSTIASTLVG